MTRTLREIEDRWEGAGGPWDYAYGIVARKDVPVAVAQTFDAKGEGDFPHAAENGGRIAAAPEDIAALIAMVRDPVRAYYAVLSELHTEQSLMENEVEEKREAAHAAGPGHIRRTRGELNMARTRLRGLNALVSGIEYRLQWLKKERASAAGGKPAGG